MNLAESLAYEPTGAGLRWMVKAVRGFLFAPAPSASIGSPLVTRVHDALPVHPDTLNAREVFAMLYGEYDGPIRECVDATNVKYALLQLTRTGHILRSGLKGAYRYGRKP